MKRNDFNRKLRFGFIIVLNITFLHGVVTVGGQTSDAPAMPGSSQFHYLPDLRLRDPYIWPDTNTGIYYLINSTDEHGPNGRPAVAAFTSKNLKTWQGPYIIFEIPKGFWAQCDIWAPQLHFYNHKYYLFLTFTTDELLPNQWQNWLPKVKRGSQILVGSSPLGPFKPFANHPALPSNMMTLDATLWVENHVPYMVFSHEWVQTRDGEMEMIQLKRDLTATAGKAKALFHGSDAPWVQKLRPYGGYVTDAPWLYRTKAGTLLMLWSSFSTTGYTVGIAVSKTGKLVGPWKQDPVPLFADNGGHASLFHRFDGQLMMILHQPNNSPNEHARLFEVEDTGGTIQLTNNNSLSH